MPSLPDALREAASKVTSDETMFQLQRLVQPGVFVRMEIDVSRNPAGEYCVRMSSATHGTKIRIVNRKGLSGTAVGAEDWQKLKAALGPVKDPRCPGDWEIGNEEFGTSKV